jgi:AraC family transcriptional regulator of adaptative response / DNA-3-methyladenine glycosylase II
VVAFSESYKPPFDWPTLLEYFRFRCIDGVEEVVEDRYRRTIGIDGGSAILEVHHDGSNCRLEVSINGCKEHGRLADWKGRIRRMFDLDADVEAIGRHLSLDPFLALLVKQRPGLRIPGGWEPFEIAARTVFGQHVSIAAARLLNGRLVQRCGAMSGFERLNRLFPTPAKVLGADLSAMGMPGARIATLCRIAQAVIDDPSLLAPHGDFQETLTKLRAIGGVGDWTAQYIALRACRQSDAFPASDVGLLRGASLGEEVRIKPKGLIARAEAWRPYRAYAAQHIWASIA